MSKIWGTFMGIGGVVMCFTGEILYGIIFYAIAALCFGFYDISCAIELDRLRAALIESASSSNSLSRFLKMMEENADGRD